MLVLEFLHRLVIREFRSFQETLENEKATIFTTEVRFMETAEIQFVPNKEQLKNVLLAALNSTVEDLDSLPRVVTHVLASSYQL